MLTNLSLPMTFDPHIHPQQIVLVGTGGTGGHCARLLARLLKQMKSLRLSVPKLRLIDFDSVEEKNVSRQLFSPADIGYPKAEILAKRLSAAFGLEIEWHPEQETSRARWLRHNSD